MTAALQARLLRVLQDHSITRLGGEAVLKLDVRVILATHKRLNDEVRAGRFREDLYYRVNVVHLHVPPLRERPEDVLWLAHRFVADWNKGHPQAERELTPEGERLLSQQRWIEPELLAALEHDTAVRETALTKRDSTSLRLEEFLREQEREFIQRALVQYDWQIATTGRSTRNLTQESVGADEAPADPVAAGANRDARATRPCR